MTVRLENTGEIIARVAKRCSVVYKAPKDTNSAPLGKQYTIKESLHSKILHTNHEQYRLCRTHQLCNYDDNLD